MKQPTILLTGGGSGGHITPVLSLARALKQASPDCSIIYIGHKGDKFGSLKDQYDSFDSVILINAGKFRRYHGESWLVRLFDFKTLALNIRDFFRLLSGTIKSWRLLGKLKPDVVFSKGGYVAVPVGLAAHWRGLPIVTHDSDILPGLANRIIGRWAAAHATGMPAEYYDYPKKSTYYVGIPVDSRIKPVTKPLQADLKRQIGLSADDLVLMVGGASQGASSLNQAAINVSPYLIKANPDLHIVHITGAGHAEAVKTKYHQLLGADSVKITVKDFVGDFYKYTGAADLVVSRAGASTLAEFAAAAKACVIIPAGWLAGGHQLKNAQRLADAKAVEVLDNDASPEKLFTLINELLQNQQRRHQLAVKMGSMARPRAAEELADLILEVAKKQGPSA